MQGLRVLLVVVCLFSATRAFAWDHIPTTGDYCKDEAANYLRQRFPGIQITEMKKLGNSQYWEIWIRTDQCSDHFVANYGQIESYNCTTAQYGSHTEFLRRIRATGDCQRLMPRDEYP